MGTRGMPASRKGRNREAEYRRSGAGCPHIGHLLARQTPENHVNQAEIAARQAPMWRSFHRQRLTFFFRRPGPMSFVFRAAMTRGVLWERPRGARAEEELLSTTGLAGQPI